MKVNDIVGTLISPIAMTPYHATRYIHNAHHTHVSDLNHRESFEIQTLTVREWEATPPLKRALYRLYRSPFTLIVFGPFLLYSILRRLPLYGLRTWSGVVDIAIHNLLLAAFLAAIFFATGWAGIAVWLGTVWFATCFGSLIPYVVHNFEEIHWGTKPELDFETAALKGSAVLDWGRFFDLVTLNIGYHDLHHLNARIPGYKLKDAHRALEEEGLITSRKIGFADGLRCLRWKLYDEDADRMVAFPKSGVTRPATAYAGPAE